MEYFDWLSMVGTKAQFMNEMRNLISAPANVQKSTHVACASPKSVLKARLRAPAALFVIYATI